MVVGNLDLCGCGRSEGQYKLGEGRMQKDELVDGHFFFQVLISCSQEALNAVWKSALSLPGESSSLRPAASIKLLA